MDAKMTVEEMQCQVDKYIGQFKEGYFPPFELLAQLTEELGELSREVQNVYGIKKKKPTEAIKSLEEEFGDFLFVLICFANAEHIDMAKALQTVLQKFETRDQDRWTRKDEE